MPFLRRSCPLLVVLAGLLYACTEPECTDLNEPQLVVQFKTRYRATRQQPERDTLIEIKAVYGAGRPGKIDSIPQRVNNLILPLSKAADATTFIIEWRRFARAIGTAPPVRIDSATNRLTVRYARQSFFVSDVCGFNVKYTNLELDTAQTDFPSGLPIDSIQVIKNVVDETNAPNIKIYF